MRDRGSGFKLDCTLAELMQIWLSAEELSEEGADALERLLIVSPYDLVGRLKLIGYLTLFDISKRARIRRRNQIYWLIRNLPSHPLHSYSIFTLQKREDPKGYSAAESMWMNHVGSLPGSAQVLCNAAAFVLRCDLSKAEELILRAQEIAPANRHLSYLKTRVAEARQAALGEQPKSKEPATLISGPVLLADGTSVRVGDSVEHATGEGIIQRMESHAHHGTFLCVEFSNGIQRLIAANLLKRVDDC